MPTLHFKRLIGSSISIGVSPTAIIYEVIKNYLNLVNGVQSLQIIVNKKSYFFGYDILLNKKIIDYDIFKVNDIIVFSHSFLSHGSANKNIKYPIMYYENKKEWPPACNWNKGDMFNGGPFLIWKGWGSGSLDVSKFKSNRYNNLVIIKGNNFKYIVNKYSYLRSIFDSDNSNKEPITGKVLSNNLLDQLKNVSLENVGDDNLLPEIELE